MTTSQDTLKDVLVTSETRTFGSGSEVRSGVSSFVQATAARRRAKDNFVMIDLFIS